MRIRIGVIGSSSKITQKIEKISTEIGKEIAKAGYRCSAISLGANTDAYQPIERKLAITRAIIEVLAATNHPLTIISKSSLVERDIDLPVLDRYLGDQGVAGQQQDGDAGRIL